MASELKCIIRGNYSGEKEVKMLPKLTNKTLAALTASETKQ